MGIKLLNAPLFYTLAQIRHNPVLKISDPKIIGEIQDRLRKMGYSDFQRHSAININFPELLAGSPGSPTIDQFERFVFANKNATKSFLVDRHAVTFQSTEYDVFETFSPDFISGLQVISECVEGFDFVNRIGIRYLDLVHPEAGQSELKYFLKPGVLGIFETLPDRFLTSYSLAECHLRCDVGNVITRTFISGGALAMPQDIQIIGIKLPDKCQISGVHAVIDTDASFEGRLTYDLDEISTKLYDLHEAASVAFKETVTPHAIDVWSKK